MRGELPPPEEITGAVADELVQSKYRTTEPWWTAVVEFLERMWARFVEWVTAISEYVGGPVVLGLLLAVALAIGVAAVTANLGRRRARSIEERIRREHAAARGTDPAELERQATDAEASGDVEAAFRLVFQAALLRLDEAELIDLTPGTTSGSVVEQLGSTDFERIAGRFDAVVYGDRPASPVDLASVRSLLSDLLGARR